MGLRIVQKEEDSAERGGFEVAPDTSALVVRYPALQFVRLYGLQNTDELLEAMINFRSTLEVQMGWSEEERRQATMQLLTQLQHHTSKTVFSLVSRVLEQESEDR